MLAEVYSLGGSPRPKDAKSTVSVCIELKVDKQVR